MLYEWDFPDWEMSAYIVVEANSLAAARKEAIAYLKANSKNDSGEERTLGYSHCWNDVIDTVKNEKPKCTKGKVIILE
jgi:hypothetical protein